MKPLIVFIDDYEALRGNVEFVLNEKGYTVKTFSNFKDALTFIKAHKPDLIISDLIGHDHLNGINFYIDHIMSMNIQFAIWTGSLDFKNKEHVKDFEIFIDGLPEGYKVSFDPEIALIRKNVDLVIEDEKSKVSSRFPIFQKEGDLGPLLTYFGFEDPVSE